MQDRKTHELPTDLQTMSPEEALALGKSILKEAFYETPTENEDDLLTKAFQLRQIASDKGASEF